MYLFICRQSISLLQYARFAANIPQSFICMSTVVLLRRSLREFRPAPQDFHVFAVIHFFIFYTTFHCFQPSVPLVSRFPSLFLAFLHRTFVSNVLVVSAIFDSNAFMIFSPIITLYNTLILLFLL